MKILLEIGLAKDWNKLALDISIKEVLEPPLTLVPAGPLPVVMRSMGVQEY